MADETPGTFGGSRCDNVIVWLGWRISNLQKHMSPVLVAKGGDGDAKLPETSLLVATEFDYVTRRIVIPAASVVTKRADELYGVLKAGLDELQLPVQKLAVYCSDCGGDATGAYTMLNTEKENHDIFFSPCIAHALSNAERKAANDFGRVSKFLQHIVRAFRFHWTEVLGSLRDMFGERFVSYISKPRKPIKIRWLSFWQCAVWARNHMLWLVGDSWENQVECNIVLGSILVLKPIVRFFLSKCP
jgi:hypothetical protein